MNIKDIQSMAEIFDAGDASEYEPGHPIFELAAERDALLRTAKQLSTEGSKLQEALCDLIYKFHIGDEIYSVRDRIDSEWFNENPGKSSWDHPDVVRYGECCEIIENAVSGRQK